MQKVYNKLIRDRIPVAKKQKWVIVVQIKFGDKA